MIRRLLFFLHSSCLLTFTLSSQIPYYHLITAIQCTSFILKATGPPSSFHSISTKLYCKYVGQEGIQVVQCNCFWRSAKIKNFYSTLKLLLIQDHMKLEITKRTPPAVFIWSGPNFMINTAVIGSYGYFGNLPKITIGVNGKPKMWNISKTANRRAKRTKIWDSGYYSAHTYGTFDAWFLEFDLGSFGALCKKNFFLNATAPLIFIQFQPNFIVSMLVMREFRL